MTTKQFDRKATELLKLFIKENGYVSSGSLLKSIKFTSTVDNQGKFDVNLEANSYIEYLEKGNFLPRFFKSTSFLGLYETFIGDMIEKDLNF
jgi:hypothetical protein